RPTNTAIAPWTESHSEWTAWAGAFPVQPVQFGLVARRYIHEVGPHAHHAMAEVAASTRNFGHINPDAVYFGRGPFTAEEGLASRYAAEPLTLLMCSAVNDGGCAMIMTRRDRVPSGKKGVRVVCGAGLSRHSPYNEPPTLEGFYELTAHYRDTVARSGV